MFSRLLAKAYERRRTPRFSQPSLTLLIGGKRYKTRDWSLGGFRLTGLDGHPEIFEKLAGTISGPRLASNDGSFVAEVLRIEEDGTIGARFLELAPGSLVAMGSLRHH